MTIPRGMLAYFVSNHEQSSFIDWSLPIIVASSAAGYYVGQLDRDGAPYSRLSQEYFATREAAQAALQAASFTARLWL